jgi:type I restriction enzyme S subunit
MVGVTALSTKYAVYPKYKSSEIDWSDVLPSDWGRVSLRWISTMYAGGTPSKNIEEYWEGGTVPWLNSGAVNQRLVTEASTFITQDAFKNSSAKWIPKNALVMALAGQGKTKGMVAQLDIDTTCNQSMAAIVPDALSDSRFLFWWLTTNYQNIRNMSGGDNRDGLNLELLGNIECPIPSNEEKQKIANFLDYETAKIDTLIDKQQQLITLLKEKRQAVISHAVTKGLNPNAPMRDSGVEWLGEVPAHWMVSKIKQVAKLESGHTPDKKVEAYWVDCNIPWVSLNDSTQLKQVDYISETAFYLNAKGMENSSARELPARCVVFTRDASIGLAAITTKVMAVSQHVIAWVCDENKVIPEYLLLVFYAMEDELNRYTSGATLKTIGLPDVNKLSGAFPHIKEQSNIAKSVFSEMRKFDLLINKAEAVIGIIRERRTALISAAVTGKIDVRSWQAPQASNNNKEVAA